MPKEKASVSDVLLKAFNESGGKTIDLVVDHSILNGVTGEMFQWWTPSISGAERYIMWCPEEHVDFKWEIPPTQESPFGSIHIAAEKLGDYPASGLRIRLEDPRDCPINRIYLTFGCGSMLTPDNRIMVSICHEFEETPDGIRMRSTFRLPSKTPKRFIDALRRHNYLEMGHLPEFLPELFRKETGKQH